ncbi:MAG: hypothetical protein P9M07_01755 [Candidatus Aceula meridiana]|nr:hypothetical protein [Candidatus Aceula meridiana]
MKNFGNYKISDSSVWVSKRIIFLLCLISLMLLWMMFSSVLRSADQWFSNIVITAIISMLLSVIAVNTITPQISKAIKYYLILWVVLKIIFAVFYFNGQFIHRFGDSVNIIHYGDSSYHHQVAVNYYGHWSEGKLFTNPDEISSSISQWGYDYFLGILYYITGPLPETGVIVNSFLALIFCLLGYKLFILAGLSQRNAQFGLIALSLFPLLWILSSYLYKDSLLFVVVLACVIEVLKILKKPRIRNYLTGMALFVILVPLRFTYIFPIFLMLVIGSVYLDKKNLRMKSITLFSYGMFLLLFSILLDRLNLFHSGSIMNIVGYIKVALQVPTLGGHFMTQGLGKNINLYNFYYVLPAKAVYILMIPFPWFGWQSRAAQMYFIFSHLDAIYYFSLLVSVGMAFYYRRKILISKEQKLLLLVGLALFIIPLFMFFPSRRYVSVCVPFFMAYALPIWIKRKFFLISIFISFGIILVIQFLYYLR